MSVPSAMREDRDVAWVLHALSLAECLPSTLESNPSIFAKCCNNPTSLNRHYVGEAGVDVLATGGLANVNGDGMTARGEKGRGDGDHAVGT